MNNNDILRRIRFALDFNDSKMMDLFALGGNIASRAEISNWLKKDEHEEFQKLSDYSLSVFLNGLIIDKRGKKDGIELLPEKRLDNNIIFRKLKIAMNFKDDEILEILKSSNIVISKHELSAFFRNPNQTQFRPCQDQILRNFIHGMQIKFRGI